VNLKTYQAYSMAEALAAVKRDLGADAVILNTRSFKRGGVLGMGRRTVIEVTATAAEQQRVKRESRKRAGGSVAAASRAYGQAGSAEISEGPSEKDRERTKLLAQIMLDRLEGERQDDLVLTNQAVGDVSVASSAATVEAETRVEPTPVTSVRAPEEAASPAGVSVISPVARRFVLQRADGNQRGETGQAASEAACAPDDNRGETVGTTSAESEASATSTIASETIEEELVAIREMVSHVLQRQTTSAKHAAPTMPQKLFDMYLHLIAQEVSEELADATVNAVGRVGG